jgi:hypothetical protein
VRGSYFTFEAYLQYAGPSVVQVALISIVLSILPVLKPTPALAQDSRPGKNLTDMSLEELMTIRIDSVYGASVTFCLKPEAP